jgi:ankyrin repeat protein
MINLLLGSGANVNMQDRQGNTPLHALLADPAQIEFNYPAIATLAQHGVDFDLANKHKITPRALVEGAAHDGHVLDLFGKGYQAIDGTTRQIYRQTLSLIPAKALPPAKFSPRQSTLGRSTAGKSTAVKSTAAKSPARQSTMRSKSPAASRNAMHARPTPTHRSTGASKGAAPAQPVTPLPFTSNPDAIESALNNGASINAQDAQGNTSLHYLLSDPDKIRSNAPAIAVLAKRGASFDIANNAKITPHQIIEDATRENKVWDFSGNGYKVIDEATRVQYRKLIPFILHLPMGIRGE